MPHMLLVTDEAPALRWLPDWLSDIGFAVVPAETAEAALGALRPRPDVVLIDAVLGHGDGYALCQDLRSACPESFIVMMSARPGKVAEMKARAAGADVWLLKPFTLAGLKAVLENRGGGQ